MRHRIWEILKDLVLVLLVCSLLLLAVAALPVETIRSHQWLSSLLQPMSPLLGFSQAELAYMHTQLPIMDAAQPTCISVKNETGRSTAMWSFDALDAAFETFGSTLGQALDTAGDFDPVEQEQIFEVLRGPSVSFRYEGSLSAALLASWLDAELEPDAPAARLFILASEGGAVQLYLVGDGCWEAQTQVDAGQLKPLLQHSRPDGSRFAFEAGLNLDPFCVIPAEDPMLPSGVVSNPSSAAYIDRLAGDFGFNPYNETRYTDESGTTYFSELGCSLQITAGGEILLTSSARDRFSAKNDSQEALVELARHLVQTAAVPGAARLYLSGLEQQEDETICTFDYFYHAVPLAMAGGHGARVVFTEDRVSELQLQLVRFTRAEQLLQPLPVAQVRALLPKGAPLALQYCITPDHTLTLGWKNA